MNGGREMRGPMPKVPSELNAERLLRPGVGALTLRGSRRYVPSELNAERLLRLEEDGVVAEQLHRLFLVNLMPKGY